MNKLSIRAFAKHRGVTPKAVRKAIAEGRITPERDGRIDAARADRDWADNTRPRPSASGSLTKSRAEREHYEAKLARLRYEERAGRLVDADEVRASTFELARRARDQLLNIPERVAPLIVGRDDIAEVREILEKEVRKVCAELGAGKAAARSIVNTAPSEARP